MCVGEADKYCTDSGDGFMNNADSRMLSVVLHQIIYSDIKGA